MDLARVTDVQVRVLDSQPGSPSIPTGPRVVEYPTMRIKRTTVRSSLLSVLQWRFWKDKVAWMKTSWCTRIRIIPLSASVRG